MERANFLKSPEVALNHFDVLELVARNIDPRICLGVDMGHVTPVVGVQWALAGVKYETVSACAIDGGREAVDLGLCRRMPG